MLRKTQATLKPVTQSEERTVRDEKEKQVLTNRLGPQCHDRADDERLELDLEELHAQSAAFGPTA